MIKLLVTVCMTLALAACGTVGGALSGAGQDLDKAGNWIKKQQRIPLDNLTAFGYNDSCNE